MPWGYAIAAVATYAGSENQKKGAKDAAKAQAAGSQAAIDEQRRQFDLTRSDMAPWLAAGGDALSKQQAFLNGDFSGFEKAPDYLFARDQGINAVDKYSAARGGFFGGGHEKDLVKFASGLATQNADNYYSKLAGLSNTGNQTGQSLGQFGANMANQIGAQYNNIGNARQSSYINQANANSNMYNSLGQLAGSYFGQRNGSGG